MEEEQRSLAELEPLELETVATVVTALVDHDLAYLRSIGAIGEGRCDPYQPTRNWRLWDQVDLAMPPGAPTTWEGSVFGVPTPANPWVALDVQMWTRQEGMSELILHIDVAGQEVLYRGLWS